MGSSRDQGQPLTLLGKGDLILEVLPTDGSKISRRCVFEKIRKRHGKPLSETEYEAAIDHMIALGRIRRRPGTRESVQRTAPLEIDDAHVTNRENWHMEKNLYAPVERYIRLDFWRDPNVALEGNDFVSITGNSRHSAGGRWGVPDLVMVSRRDLPMFRKVELEVTTFEIKPQKTCDERSIHQAAQQALGAHRGYVLWHCADNSLRSNMLTKLFPICDRTGIGLITTSAPNNLQTYRIERVARLQRPDQPTVNRLLHRYLSGEDRKEFEAWSSRRGMEP